MTLIITALFGILVVLEMAYIAIARRLHLGASRPEERFVPVGGGIIFIIGAMLPLYLLPCTPAMAMTLAGGALLALISFIDDIKALSAGLRLCIQTIVFSLVLWPLIAHGRYDIFLICLIGCVGFINSTNFIDGTDGMLAGGSLVTIATLYAALEFFPLPLAPVAIGYISILKPLCIGLGLAVAVFALFNFRKKALVYAGDTGSITAGYFIAIILCAVAIIYDCPSVIITVAVWLIDTFCTFLKRLFDGEAVLQPHKRHLYQQLIARGYSTIGVSASYAALQLVINALWLFTPEPFRNLYAMLMALLLLVAYTALTRQKNI